MISMNMLIELNDSEAREEKELELAINKLCEEENLAIQHRQNFKFFLDEKEMLMEKLRMLKGGCIVVQGYKLASNSTELAKALIKRADILGKLEDDIFSEKIDELREEQNHIKIQIEKLISKVKQNGFDNKFEDIKHAIEFWEKAKVDVFTRTGEDLARAWAYLVGQKPEFVFSKNYIGHLIRQLKKMEEDFLELKHQQRVQKQSDHIKSACRIVSFSNDDNEAFREIFLMGQYASNLNHIELKLSEYRKKQSSKKGASSRSVWASELALMLYVDHWIIGELPTACEAMRFYSDILDGQNVKTVQNQMASQRKKLSKIDEKVPKVVKTGRNKKINSRLPL